VPEADPPETDRCRVVVLAGPSGSGKSRLSRRLGLPVLNLDDFYRDGDDPTLPRLESHGPGPQPPGVDWDDPRSWSYDDAMAVVTQLCARARADVPTYDIATDRRTGHHELSVGEASHFVAEGIFAQEIVRECSARGLLADAVCLRHNRWLTFARRLVRDLREHRKPPAMLLRRGVMLLRDEPRVVARAVALGCTAMSGEAAYRRITALVSGSRPEPPRRSSRGPGRPARSTERDRR